MFSPCPKYFKFVLKRCCGCHSWKEEFIKRPCHYLYCVFVGDMFFCSCVDKFKFDTIILSDIFGQCAYILVSTHNLNL